MNSVASISKSDLTLDDSIMFLSENNQSKFILTSQYTIDFINSSFQKELVACFPELNKSKSIKNVFDGDYDDSIDEKSNFKNIPQEFY